MSLREVEPAAWDRVLDRLGLVDVYLRRMYVETACRLETGRPVFLQRGDVIFAAVVREVPGADVLDVTTPYGYGGPVAVREEPGEGFWRAYESWCAERGIVTSFFRFHPLYGNHRYARIGAHLEQLAGTVAWRVGEDDLFARMDASHRNTCRKAERSGVTVSVQEQPERLTGFAALYEETMRRRDAAPAYVFPPEYWDALAAGLRDRLVRFDAHLEGETVASALCMAAPPWLHYHLGGSVEPARRTGASNLLLYRAACWARENAFELFHLGGGVGGRDDSLLAFKRSFDPGGVRESWVGKAIHDVEAYRRLSGADEPSFDGFFPAYRRR